MLAQRGRLMCASAFRSPGKGGNEHYLADLRANNPDLEYVYSNIYMKERSTDLPVVDRSYCSALIDRTAKRMAVATGDHVAEKFEK